MKKNFMLYMAIARGQQPVPDRWTKGPVCWESPIRRDVRIDIEHRGHNLRRE